MFFTRLKEDIDTILTRDPAARSRAEVLLCYPGVHAILIHRLAHWCWGRNLKLTARVLSHLAKVFTGVEIHPAATMGRRVFIDHATGVVIGETAEVGDDVTLYQGVTLGGTSLHEGKRHPTLEHGVIVGSGAQILGPHTIGAGARVGANAVVLQDVEPGVTVVGIPARAVAPRKRAEAGTASEEFCAYGMPRDELPDPVARAMDALRDQVCILARRVEELEGRDDDRRAAVVTAIDGGLDARTDDAPPASPAGGEGTDPTEDAPIAAAGGRRKG